jgi:hypothetical protein
MVTKRPPKPGEPGWEPDWLHDDKPRRTPYTDEELLEMAQGVIDGIRDSQAWRDLVAKVGEEEALQSVIAGIRWRDPNSEEGPVE